MEFIDVVLGLAATQTYEEPESWALGENPVFSSILRSRMDRCASCKLHLQKMTSRLIAICGATSQYVSSL